MNYRQRLFQEAEARRRECQRWIEQFMRPGQPKPMTKTELFELAKDALGVSRTCFDQAWIGAIEKNGRHDWYEPSTKRRPPFKH